MINVTPVGDWVEHTSGADCVCGPRVAGELVVHVALDPELEEE